MLSYEADIADDESNVKWSNNTNFEHNNVWIIQINVHKLITL
jgi:hypothetical protein